MVIITGAGRSGTSMVSQLLQQFGLDFGNEDELNDLNPADQFNERGYYEQKDVNNLNSRLITSYPRRLNIFYTLLSRLVYTTMPNQNAVLARAKIYSQEIRDVSKKYSKSVVKDPRFSITLPAWQLYGEFCKVLVCIRHPAEVVQSLKRALNYPTFLGYKFWNYHNENILDNINEIKKKVLFVNFNLLSSENFINECNNLRSFLELNLTEDELHQAYQKVFSKRLKHFDVKKHHRIPAKTAKIWDKLNELHMKQKY